MALKLYLVRHGQTAWNKTFRYMGHNDEPLDETGCAQAAAVAQRLASQQFTAIYSSDLQRAWQTAAAIAAHQACPLIAEPRLREMHFGEWQGLTYAEIQQRDPWRLATWESDRLDMAPPGGESLRQLAARVQAVMDMLAEAHPQGDILVVSHGGPLRVLASLALGFDPVQYWHFSLENASLSQINLYPDGAILQTWNDACHLGGARWEN
jgi:alpha-ribazole phosphatase